MSMAERLGRSVTERVAVISNTLAQRLDMIDKRVARRLMREL